MPVRSAVADGLYGGWTPSKVQTARLEATFPEGVCDYELPSVGDPEVSVAPAPDVRTAAGVLIISATPGAVVQLRSGGEVVAEHTANRGGRVTMTHVPRGTYVLRQIVDGEPSLRTAPVTVR